MIFQVRIQPVQRLSEYRGAKQDGEAYVIGTWKVKNVSDGSVILVSCFTKDDETLSKNMHLEMDAELSIFCRDWNKDGKSGSMNNVNLSKVVGPQTEQDIPNNAPPPIASSSGSIFNPADNPSDLPFSVGFSVIP